MKNVNKMKNCEKAVTRVMSKVQKIDSLGRLTIPKAIRDRCGIHSTRHIRIVMLSNNSVLIEKIPAEDANMVKTDSIATDATIKKTLLECLTTLMSKLKD